MSKKKTTDKLPRPDGKLFVTIYARYSSDGQREESIEGQLRECKEYAERQNMVVISTYIDRAVSARTDNRPKFQKMITDSAKRQFEDIRYKGGKRKPSKISWQRLIRSG